MPDIQSRSQPKLWFDVGIGWYTTVAEKVETMVMLWFDVGIGWYTIK